MNKRLTTEEFIAKAKKTHTNNYDYSLVDYVNRVTKVKIISENGFIHEIIPSTFLNGIKLSLRNVINKDMYLIHKFKEIHDDKFDYSKFTYTKPREKCVIICSKHGEFNQTICNHLKGKGCPRCNGKNRTTNDIIVDFKRVHGDTYDYSKVVYKLIKNKVTIICSKHGDFKQSPEEHINGCGCPICKESRGEREVRQYLEKNNIKYIPQHKFSGCRHKLELPFDFYLPDLNVTIEYQGEQHFKPVKIFGGDSMFKIRKIRDKIKSDYCLNNQIKLISIPYTENVSIMLTELKNS